ncbi:MAG: NUDIX domain-containing protein [Solobacterium sp.]|nr:NUDIX domain-containing protein [Solobacterium sp.]
MKQEKSCGAVIFREKNDHIYFLIIRQNQGHWCFPKGHCEPGESEQETAWREIKEETGLEVKFFSDFRATTSYSPKEDVIKEVVYFLANPEGGELRLQEEEVQDVRWVRRIDAAALLTYDNDIELFKKAVRYIKLNYNVWENDK